LTRLALSIHSPRELLSNAAAKWDEREAEKLREGDMGREIGCGGLREDGREWWLEKVGNKFTCHCDVTE